MREGYAPCRAAGPAKQVNTILQYVELHAIYGNTMYYHTGSEIIYKFSHIQRAVNTLTSIHQSNLIALSPPAYMYMYIHKNWVFFQGKPLLEFI